MQYLTKNTITNEISYQDIDIEFINELLENDQQYLSFIKPNSKEIKAFLKTQEDKKIQEELNNLKSQKLLELENIYNKSQICLIQDGLDSENKTIILPVLLKDSGHLPPIQKQFDQAEREGKSFIRLSATNGKDYISILSIEEWSKLFYPKFLNISTQNNNLREILRKRIVNSIDKETLNNIDLSVFNTNYSIKLSDSVNRGEEPVLLENTIENFEFLMNN